MKNLIPVRFVTFVLVSFLLLLSEATYAQKNPDIPRPRGPVDLSETANVIMFIVLPALVIIGFFFWRIAMKKRREE
jgi:hypothetical protein